MAKLDSQNRLTIPNEILKISKINFADEVRLYLFGDELFLDNPSDKHYTKNCLGQINFDSKHRFFVPKQLVEALHLDRNKNILFYVREDVITFHQVKTSPN